MHVEGACHCGRIRFTAEVDPDRVMVCHCTDCQVLCGAPFRTIVPAPLDSFRLQGTGLCPSIHLASPAHETP